MVSRNSSGHFIKGCGLPQTPEGWIDRYVLFSERKTIDIIGLKPIRDKIYKLRALQDPIKHKIILKQKRAEYQRNKSRYEKSRKEYRQKYPEKTQYQNNKYWQEHREWLIENQYDYYWNRGGREVQRIWNKNNPRSGGGSDDIEVILAMNNVRKRDNNTCQWAGCGLTHKDTIIHVHHIFPRSEYPELDTVEQYMICYCANHHGLWHRYRGDDYAEFISPTYQQTSMEQIFLRDPDSRKEIH